MNSEWEVASVDQHIMPKGSFMRIVEIDGSERNRIYFSRPAYEAMGKLEYVQMMLSKANGDFKVKFLPSVFGISNTRRIRTKASGIVAMGGGSSLIKKYHFPYGYYMMDENQVFTWKYP